MKKNLIVGMMSVCAVVAPAQESELETLKRALREQQRTIESLLKKVEALEKQQSSVTNEQAELKRLVETPMTNLAPVTAAGTQPERRWSPSDPIRLLGNAQNYINISFDGIVAAGASTADDVEELQLGGHDPKQRGFTVQNLETVFEGKVDPYFRGQANVVISITPDGETILEAEEAYLETMALPWNLQVKAGQYLTEFGRQNPAHPHSWAFVDQSLVNARFFGPDGLRNPGARVSWLLPTPFFAEVALSVQNSGGETAASFRSSGAHAHGDEDEEELPFGLRHADNDRGVRHLDDLLFAPRFQTSFDLSDAQTLLLGASAALGPNASGGDGDPRTQIYGLDFTWKWKPVSHSGGFPFVMWQNEAMLRRYKLGAFDWDENGNGAADEDELIDVASGLPASFGSETVTDYGLYSQVIYGFRKGWIAGLRFDYVWGEEGDYESGSLSFNGETLTSDPARDRRWRVSPNLTWYPTEFSKLRLQYNYDDRRHIGVDHSVWLQWEFLLGAHAAHKF
jgi:hypothetical protein